MQSSDHNQTDLKWSMDQRAIYLGIRIYITNVKSSMPNILSSPCMHIPLNELTLSVTTKINFPLNITRVEMKWVVALHEKHVFIFSLEKTFRERI